MINKTFKPAFLLLISITMCLGAQAQNTQQEYLNGKSFFKDEKYSLAMEIFKPIISQNDSKEYAPYASFYYAVAAYKQQYPALARDMFLQLNERYPKWKNKAEVNFWLSKIYFEQGDFKQAIGYAKDKSHKELNAKQKKYYFNKVSSMDSLKMWHQQFPKDQDLGFVLAKAITKQSVTDQDRTLLLSLIDDFDFSEDDFEIASINESIKKDEYQIAVIMPFMFDKLAPSRRQKSNQFVFDLYEGITLAAQTLNDHGYYVKIYSYDTRKDVTSTNAILEKEEMKSMDLIIGPLYPEPSAVVSEFSYRQKINMINPLSANQKVIGNNPYSFLYLPQYATQAKAAAEYVKRNIVNKNSMIFYGGTQIDSIMAHTYKEEVEKDSFKIVMMKKIPKDTSRYILQMLTSTYEYIEETRDLNDEERSQYILSKDSVGSIYVASDHRLLASNVVSAVEIRGDSIAVVGSGKWLEYKFIDYSAYERLGITLIAPNYIINTDSTYNYINEFFIDRYSTPASKHAYYGYDLMMYMGTSLHAYGTFFQKDLYNKEFTNGTLTPGYSYMNANDNQFVPVLQFKNSSIEVINHPTTASDHDN